MTELSAIDIADGKFITDMPKPPATLELLFKQVSLAECALIDIEIFRRERHLLMSMHRNLLKFNTTTLCKMSYADMHWCITREPKAASKILLENTTRNLTVISGSDIARLLIYDHVDFIIREALDGIF